MTEPPKAGRDSDELYARKAAAFLAWLDHIPTVNNPTGGDRKIVERAQEILAEPLPGGTSDQGEQ